MKLGERRKLGDKEYAAVYDSFSCSRCALRHLNDMFSGGKTGICKEVYSKTWCRAYENGRWQENVWIEVKK
ncbi:MAG: hypothetical protein GY707_03880 [Desulfobacteraceae bacterium]|nr:hypothetical protein [Desulfobacteraceae bacterium]